MTAQIVDLARQILLNGASDAGIQRLRLTGAVAIAVEIGGLVEYFDVAIECRPPLDEGHKRAGMALQGCAVGVDAVQQRGRNRKTIPGINFRWAINPKAAAAAFSIGSTPSSRMRSFASAKPPMRSARLSPRSDEFRERIAMVVPFA